MALLELGNYQDFRTFVDGNFEWKFYTFIKRSMQLQSATIGLRTGMKSAALLFRVSQLSYRETVVEL